MVEFEIGGQIVIHLIDLAVATFRSVDEGNLTVPDIEAPTFLTTPNLTRF